MSDLVKIIIGGGVADVRLNRPDRYNSLSPEMFEAVVAAGQSIAANLSVRAVVLSGEGKGFCAGLDMETFAKVQSIGNAVLAEKTDGTYPNPFQNAAYIWKTLRVPVIAAIHGSAFGGGIQIALGADIRLASPDARLCIMEVNWGLIPDMAASQTLRGLVRIDVAKELIWTGRILSGEEAQKLGLVTRVCDDPLAEALKMAHEIAKKSPDAIIAGKRLIETSWLSPPEVGLKMEEELQKSLLGSPNQVEAVKAKFEKRPPDFQNAE
ncbi:Enoyl-CoA hydratase/isomerase family protein [uncultured Desulfobacterium sp.]|uniref:Enoyl-CoA hydratase/isomerase family protein n=1 Tax=uncultured Desulfobacterium sp. TaxID=201089 RepID=A0A445N491_9BACT|nr:Enoyl-CoA hydratase/isomerase family protein [uncultured Desulfobacterium sp.]